MSSWNSVLSWVEHEKSFIISGASFSGKEAQMQSEQIIKFCLKKNKKTR